MSVRRILLGFCVVVGCADAASTSMNDIDSNGSSTGGTDSSATTALETATSSSGDIATSEGPGDESSGGGEPADPPYSVGSRLQPVLQRNADGVERLATWHDPDLGFDCAFTETADGWACAPNRTWSEAFADEGCNTPATYWTGCDAPPLYARTPYAGCGPVGVLRRGDPLDRVYVRNGNGECTERENVDGYAVEPVDSSVLVGVERMLQPADDNLGYWRYSADDGSTQLAGPVLLADEQTCEPVRFGDEAACLANGTLAWNFGFLHRDASCSSDDVAYATAWDGCDPPRFVRDDRGERGTITEQLDLDEVWFGYDAEACTPLEDTQPNYLPYAYRPFEIGDAPSIVFETLGEGRLRLQQAYADDGAPISGPSGLWFDTAYGFECGYTDDTFGEQRCVPYSFVSASDYEDPQCERPLMFDRSGVEGAWRTVFEYPGDCERRLLGFAQVGGLHRGPYYQRNADGVCEETTPSSHLRTLDLHPPSEAAELQEIRP